MSLPCWLSQRKLIQFRICTTIFGVSPFYIFTSLYISACHDNRLIDRESPFTNTANGWTIDCDMGVWDTADQIENLDVPRMCSNWYGFMNNDPIGSISTTFHGRGRARLDFGNCWTSGTVYAYLNGNAIAAASANTPR